MGDRRRRGEKGRTRRECVRVKMYISVSVTAIGCVSMGGEEKFPTILLLKQDRCERDRDIEIKFGANSSGDPLQQL